MGVAGACGEDGRVDLWPTSLVRSSLRGVDDGVRVIFLAGSSTRVAFFHKRIPENCNVGPELVILNHLAL